MALWDDTLTYTHGIETPQPRLTVFNTVEPVPGTVDAVGADVPNNSMPSSVLVTLGTEAKTLPCVTPFYWPPLINIYRFGENPGKS